MSVGSRKLNLAYQGLSEMPAELTNHHTALIEELDLTGNRIVDLKFLIEYQNLETLVLDHNNIRSHVKMAQLPRLHTLWVNHNRINNLGVFISTLAKNCPSLRILSMMNNDAAPSYFNSGTFQQYMDYRYFVISKLPKLQLLDDKKVMPDERSEAERIYKPVPKKRKRTNKATHDGMEQR